VHTRYQVPRSSCIADPSYRLICKRDESLLPEYAKKRLLLVDGKIILSEDCEETRGEDPRIESLHAAPPSAAMQKARRLDLVS
jgi:hypothetical protein